jgi:HKD family nuclease/diadenosine tetraphosphate (Ap4A) HIT family hydrolase
LALGLWDAFPVSPGHALVVPRRHIATWWDATPEEQRSLLAAIAIAREEILRRYRPHGFNIGWNSGAAAGQTVFHLHVHVIPRYSGDVPDPRGGVRHVIPAKANYLAKREAPPTPPGLPHRNAIICGAEDRFLPHLRTSLEMAKNADLAVAFVLESGVRGIFEHLRDLLSRGGRLRLVTGDYLGVTEPDALTHLLDLEGDVHLRVYEAGDGSFHPKAYLFHHQDGGGTAYVGSSNLSATALGTGVEWNYRVISSCDVIGFGNVVAAFEALFSHPRTSRLTAEWLEAYRGRRGPVPFPEAKLPAADAPPQPPQPHSVQQEALRALEKTRADGNRAGLVVLATGLGKTWLAAFDSDRPEFRKVLFVAHRDEILSQALETFRCIRPHSSLGRYTGAEKAPDADVLFASVQTLGKVPHLQLFAADAFDYVVIDEFHHAAASTYRRLIQHFAPKFLLGLTATPERADGGDLLALCQENLVYRVVGPQGGRHVARPQRQHHELVVVGAGDDQGQVLVLVVVAVPERQLLVAVGRVIDRVQVERQVRGRGVEGGDELVKEHVAQPLEGFDADGVLEAGQRRLAGPVVIPGRAVGQELEDRIGAQGVVVVLVFVPGEDAEDAGPDHLQERVLGEVRVPGVVERLGKRPGEPDALVELADGQLPGVAGQLARRRLDGKGVPKKSRTWGQAGAILIHSLPHCGKEPECQQVRRICNAKYPEPAQGIRERLFC